jgi:hypothetical protein
VTEAPGSTVLLSSLKQTAHLLDTHRQPWALVGGLAVSVRVEPRFTRDIDLAVAVIRRVVPISRAGWKAREPSLGARLASYGIGDYDFGRLTGGTIPFAR